MNKLLYIFLLFCSLKSLGQAPRTYTSSEILLQVKKLNVLGSVLYIAAHPDDENTRLLAYLANEKLYRTGYLSLTRGDGGQNLIGDEQGVELGLIRTQELLSARRIDGAEQFFSRAYDFGYSKSPAETFKIWDKNKILSDVVWTIRKFQPDVIITRFPTTGEGGHGHHTASAILAEEAFDAAADPSRYPEQFRYGVKPWQAKRLLWNTFNFGNTNTTNEQQFKLDVGGFNALLGKSYGEIAADSRSQHKSQGFGVPRSRGSQIEYFKTIRGTAPFNDLAEGVEQSWARIIQSLPSTGLKIGAPGIKTMVDESVRNFSDEHPENSVPALVDIYKEIFKTEEGYWRNQKLMEVVKLLEGCSGLFVECSTAQQFIIQGDSLHLNVFINNRSGANITAAKIKIGSSYFPITGELKKNNNIRQAISVFITDTQSISQPYWLNHPLDRGNFVVSQQELIGKPENDPFSVSFIINIEGIDISFVKPIQFKTNDPVKGELYQPLVILPKVEVNYSAKNYLALNKKPAVINVTIVKNAPVVNDLLIKNMHSSLLQELVIQKTERTLVSSFSSEKQALNFQDVIKAVASDGKSSWSNYRKIIRYDHIPTIVYFPGSEASVVSMDLKIIGKNIGYINGAGDKVPEALELMGFTVTQLNEKDITTESLKKFDAVITGVRSYNVHEWLNANYDVLMNYIKGGGNLIVQYNVNGLKAKIGPYPFVISNHRVTDEEAEVRFLQPDHPVLNYPNKITKKDFEGWIQERSTYNAENLDPKYQPIFTMKDPGETEQNGSLIVADFGKGRFVYSGLVFFRQLPAGVPGAFRLFANLLAKRQMTTKGSLK